MSSIKHNVIFGILDPFWDANVEHPSTGFWRPTVSMVSTPDFPVHRIELVVQVDAKALGDEVIAAIQSISPQTTIRIHPHQYRDLWDFEEMYGYFHDLVEEYPFDLDAEDYFVHMSTGTHVMRICLFLLAESRLLPGRMLQTFPTDAYHDSAHRGSGLRIIDLDLARYDQLAKRFAARSAKGTSVLKSGIKTCNPIFNQMIEEIEQVAIASTHPILLTGPTGAGKSQLAERIFALKKQRHQVRGEFVPVNCATLRGDGAMSTLFGHRKGAFTGAVSDRSGMLRMANGGLLFLDEIGELGLEEQAMLLRAIETGKFYPVGSDKEEQSHFQLIAGTNRDLIEASRQGRFREDLLARINLWNYQLPGLSERREDIEPNLDYELAKFAHRSGKQVSFNKEAKLRFLAFAMSPHATWAGSFRDLNASFTRMATLAPGGRITPGTVEREIGRLHMAWQQHASVPSAGLLEKFLPAEQIEAIDSFDRTQLIHVINICRQSRTIAEAGRVLFQASRKKRSVVNDSDRIRKYLARFGLDWQQVVA